MTLTALDWHKALARLPITGMAFRWRGRVLEPYVNARLDKLGPGCDFVIGGGGDGGVVHVTRRSPPSDTSCEQVVVWGVDELVAIHDGDPSTGVHPPQLRHPEQIVDGIERAIQRLLSTAPRARKNNSPRRRGHRRAAT